MDIKMKLKEIVETKGTYIGLKLSEKSKIFLTKLIKDFDIDNPISEDDFHVTLVYSRKPAVKNIVEPDNIYKCKIDTWDVWESQGKKSFIVKLKCQKLIDRHKELIHKYSLTHDFPDYTPHITLSYNLRNDPNKDVIEKVLKKLDQQIILTDEYQEDLFPEWADDK